MLKLTRIRNRAETKFPRGIPGSRFARGLSLIEILVALLVLSIGLAGMAALHLNSLKNVSSSYYRSLASTIALDYEERLWLEAARLADTDPATAVCPDEKAIAKDLVDDWTSTDAIPDWASGDAERATLPSLTVTTETPKPAGSGPTDWIEIPITVGWADSRFKDQTSEVFDYTVRTLCRQPPATSG